MKEQPRSALDGVVQVEHAVALDHHIGIVEENGAGMAAEEPHAFAQDHGGDVHRHLVDESCGERLSADVACGHADQSVAGELLGERDGGLDGVGCVERVRRGTWRATVLAAVGG